MAIAWKELEYKLEIKDKIKDHLTFPKGKTQVAALRCSHRILNRYPINMLIVETGQQQAPQISKSIDHWELMINKTTLEKRPKIVVESWTSRAAVWENGPAGKGSRVRWKEKGYATRIRHVDTQYIGGAIVQPRLLVVRVREEYSKLWMWTEINITNTPRPMSNVLTPAGLIKRKVRYRNHQQLPILPDSTTDPMPPRPGQWIITKEGVRRTLLEEFGRAIGIPNTWETNPARIDTSILEASTSVFHWEYISQCLVDASVLSDPDRATSTGKSDEEIEEKQENDSKIKWKPPDLSEDGE